MEPNRFWESIKYFSYLEFSAPEDRESGLLMNHFLVMSLDDLRKLLGSPIIIHENGGYSFKGHSENSFHYEGKAVDFHVHPDCKLSPRQQAQVILSTGKFGGVGFYPVWHPVPGFHVDVRQGFQIWKKVGGQYIYLFE
jgi:hypothetical protein